jgi:hypothetical protein
VSIDRQVWNVRKGEDGSGIEEVPIIRKPILAVAMVALTGTPALARGSGGVHGGGGFHEGGFHGGGSHGVTQAYQWVWIPAIPAVTPVIQPG